jgi:uncharacterized lipoprotein YajG
MMKMKTALSALLIVISALIFAACQLASDLAITKAEYTNKNTFTVYYVGNPGGSVSFNVEGKDKRYAITSHTSVTIIDTKVVCKLYDDFISGDHIIITSNDVPGSAEFDVPDYKE